MKTTTIHCDICKREVPQCSWEDSPQPLHIYTNCTSQNPMSRLTGNGFQSNTYRVEDVCQRCMKALAETFAAKIESLGPVRPDLTTMELPLPR